MRSALSTVMKSYPAIIPHRVAVGQMTSTADHIANYTVVEKLAIESRERGCSMLFLPENFSFMGVDQSQSVGIASALDGEVMGRYRTLAKDLGLWLSLGGFQEATDPPGRMFNTHCLVDPQGSLRAVYRKMHLFNVEIPNGPVMLESRFCDAGRELVACPDSPVGTLGLSICYDLRFPQLYQALAFTLGARVLTVPAAFTVPTGAAHWELLLRARAVETQCYVIAAAQGGRHSDSRESWGQSLIIDPWGTIVASLPDRTETGIAVADLDFEHLDNIRTKMPIREHRKWGIACLGEAGR